MPDSVKHLLLVEDEVLIRMMVAEMLEDLGHRVTSEAGELKEALERRDRLILTLRFLT